MNCESKRTRSHRQILTVTILFCLGHAAAGEVTFRAEIGWGDLVRAGRWTPITVHVADTATRGAILDLYVPQGGPNAMRIRQFITISPTPGTFQLFAPIQFNGMDPPVVTLRDAKTFKTLARYPPDPDSFNFYSKLVDGSKVLIGVSGDYTTLAVLGHQLAQRPAEVAPMASDLLPSSAVGYDGLDLLVLNRPDLLQINLDQQTALLDWIRNGGNLLFWPSDDPQPQSSPIIQALPCQIGPIHDFLFDAGERKEQHLAIAGLRGRALAARTGAEQVSLFPQSHISAWRGRLGLGTIVVSPINLSDIRVNGGDGSMSPDLWKQVVAGMDISPADQDHAPDANAGNYDGNGGDPDARRQTQAMQRIEDFIGNVPGAGQFGFSYVAIVLIGMMIVVGPVDWFVLKWLGHQPWTWITTSGWIALITLSAVFLGHWFKSGQLHYRTVEMVEQVGKQTIGTTSLACIYSPRTRAYHLEAPPLAPGDGEAGNPSTAPTEPVGWWQPVSAAETHSSGEMKNDLEFHQTDRGNAPGEMEINIWNLRFLRSQTSTVGAPLIEATLSLKPAQAGAKVGRLVGTISNLSDKPLMNLRVQMEGGFAGVVSDGSVTPPVLVDRIEPGASARIDLPANLVPGTPPIAEEPSYPSYAPSAIPESRLWQAASDLDARCARRAESTLAGGHYACIYAEVSNPQPDAVIREPNAVEKHYKFIRAVLPLMTGQGGGATLAPQTQPAEQ